MESAKKHSCPESPEPRIFHLQKTLLHPPLIEWFPCRLAKPARRLGIVDAGFEAEWGSWGPGEELSIIPQLDGKADTREEEDAEEREKEDEMVLRDEKDEEECKMINEKDTDESDEKDEDEKVKNALESLNMILANHLVFIKPD